jgi:hypothetical protein
MRISFDLAVFYERAAWQQDVLSLAHRQMAGCTMTVGGATEWPPASAAKEIGGFEFQVYQIGAETIYLSPDVPSGERAIILVSATTEAGKCFLETETVLATLHLAPEAAQSANCPWAPPTRLKVGDRVKALISAWLRTEPRWGEATKIQQLNTQAAPEITILAGPVCAIYPGGEYLYWQVSIMPDNLVGWLAEGDSDQYFLEPIAP